MTLPAEICRQNCYKIRTNIFSYCFFHEFMVNLLCILHKNKEQYFVIKKAKDMTNEVKVNMRGGDGEVTVTNAFEKGEYKGKSRLVGTLTLEKGCSIGEHVHENEEEVFIILQGTATYNDNGKTVKLQKGDACLCLGSQKHSLRNDCDETLVVAAVILTY